jgi:hypothetical protein
MKEVYVSLSFDLVIEYSFEYEVLRKMFEPESEKVMGGRKSSTIKSFILCSSPNNIRVMISRMMR